MDTIAREYNYHRAQLQMSAEDLRAIKKLLPKLTIEELGQVKAALGALESVTGTIATVIVNKLLASSASKPESSDDARMALDVICEFMQAVGVECASPALIQKASIYPSFKHKAEHVMRFLRSHVQSKVEVRALLCLGVNLLYHDLVEMNMTASSYTLLAQFHRIPAVLNHAFPGYARAGMLNWITGVNK